MRHGDKRERRIGYGVVFFFKQKTAYEMVSDWSSDVCSSDLDSRRRNSRVSRSASHAPMEEPTRTCGPWQYASNIAMLSSSQRLMVPSVNFPSDSPCPE